jgi:hypothetical protein
MSAQAQTSGQGIMPGAVSHMPWKEQAGSELLCDGDRDSQHRHDRGAGAALDVAFGELTRFRK